jgi:RNA polymerase sigma-70 factor (ECF subfamily)
MAVMEELPVPGATLPSDARHDDGTAAPVADPVTHLAAVYRDYPGLRALILRRVHDPEVAADILQDAAVTTLQKLRSGDIADPANVGGFLYRVALNHLRNHRRKDRSGASSAAALDDLAVADGDGGADGAGWREWATLARRILEELPTARDRDVLVRFYLREESKDSICAALGLTDEHFNRVIFRARSRFKTLLESKGFAKADFLAIGALAVGLAAASAVPAPATAGDGGQARPGIDADQGR